MKRPTELSEVPFPFLLLGGDIGDACSPLAISCVTFRSKLQSFSKSAIVFIPNSSHPPMIIYIEREREMYRQELRKDRLSLPSRVSLHDRRRIGISECSNVPRPAELSFPQRSVVHSNIVTSIMQPGCHQITYSSPAQSSVALGTSTENAFDKDFEFGKDSLCGLCRHDETWRRLQLERFES